MLSPNAVVKRRLRRVARRQFKDWHDDMIGLGFARYYIGLEFDWGSPIYGWFRDLFDGADGLVGEEATIALLLAAEAYDGKSAL